MTPVFAKLNLKDQREILVLNAPGSFAPELAGLGGVTVQRDLKAVREIAFCLAFVTRQGEVDALVKPIAQKAGGDAIVWFAYPKGTSKRYASEISRDHGWQGLRALGFDTVRAVAIDEDWSALRFRRVEFVGGKAPKPAAATRSKPKAAKPANQRK